MIYKANSDTKAFFAVKAKHPTRKAADKILGINGVDGYSEPGCTVKASPDLAVEDATVNLDEYLVDIVEIKSPRQALAVMDTSYVAIMHEDKFYPVDETNVDEQFALVVAEEAPTVEEDAKFGTYKLEHFVKDPIAGGEAEDADVLGKKLNVIQEGVEIANGVMTGKLLKVLEYTGFNGSDVNEQNGYYLVFWIDKTAAEAAGYSDIKFFVVGGKNTDGVTPDQGMNIIFLGANKEDVYKKTLGLKAHLTIQVDDDTTVEDDVEIALENKLTPVDMEEQLTINPNNGVVEPVAPIVDEANKIVFLNGNEGSIKPAEDGSGAQIIVNGKVIYTGSLEGFNVYGGGKAGTHFAKSRITVNNVNGGDWSISGGGLGSFDGSEDPTLSADVDEAVVVVDGDDTVIKAIGGGSDGIGTVKDAYVTINGGTITGLNGGGFASTSAGSLGGDAAIHPENSGNKVETAHLTINGGSIPTVFGGGQGYACVEKAIIKINNFVSSSGIVISAGSNGYTGETDLTIDGADTNIGTVVSYNRGWAKKTSITINNGTINEVYAGVNGADDGSSSMEKHGIQESINITINGGTVTSIVAGDNPEAIQPNDPKVHVYVAEKATVTNIEAAKSAFGTSITVEEAAEA